MLSMNEITSDIIISNIKLSYLVHAMVCAKFPDISGQIHIDMNSDIMTFFQIKDDGSMIGIAWIDSCLAIILFDIKDDRFLHSYSSIELSMNEFLQKVRHSKVLFDKIFEILSDSKNKELKFISTMAVVDMNGFQSFDAFDEFLEHGGIEFSMFFSSNKESLFSEFGWTYYLGINNIQADFCLELIAKKQKNLDKKLLNDILNNSDDNANECAYEMIEKIGITIL